MSLENLEFLTQFKVEKIIAARPHEEVYKGTYAGEHVAIKYFDIAQSSIFSAFKHEAKILSLCQSPYIVKYIGRMEISPHGVIIMEYCSRGSLFGILHVQKEFLPWCFVRWEIALEIVTGLAYLHEKGIRHGDVKSPNVVLDEKYRAKICDFGSSWRKTSDQPLTKITPMWSAPELRQPNSRATFSSDIYSCGLVLWEMASYKKPHSNIIDEQAKVTVPFFHKETFPSDCPKSYQALVMECCSEIPTQRPLAKDVVSRLQEAKTSHIHSYYQDDIVPKIVLNLDGSAKELFQQGRIFRLNQQYRKAIRYLECAAEKNYLPACLDLYLIQDCFNLWSCEYIFLQKEFFAKKYQEILTSNIQIFEKEAETFDGEAFYNLAKCYEVRQCADSYKALTYYRKAVEKGYSLAQYDLAEFFLKNSLFPLEQDVKKAEEHFQLAADQHLALAEFRLGECYEKGIFGSNPDDEKAKVYYQRAAEGGYLSAMIKMGLTYEEANKDNPNQQSLKKACKMYQSAAEEGIGSMVEKFMSLSEWSQCASKNLTFFRSNHQESKILIRDSENILRLGPPTN